MWPRTLRRRDGRPALSCTPTASLRWFPIQERARANASWLFGIFVGSTIASSLTAFSLSAFSWTGAFYLQAGIALVLAFGISLLLIKDDPRDASTVGSSEVTHIEENRFENTTLIPKDGPESPYRNYRYWLTMVMYLGTNIPFYGLVTWLPLYLKDQRHISFGMVGVILTAANALSIVVMVSVGMWSDRKMRRAGTAALGFAVQGPGEHPDRGDLGVPRAGRERLVHRGELGTAAQPHANGSGWEVERYLLAPDEPRRGRGPRAHGLDAQYRGQLHPWVPPARGHDRRRHRLLRNPDTAEVLTARCVAATGESLDSSKQLVASWPMTEGGRMAHTARWGVSTDSAPFPGLLATRSLPAVAADAAGGGLTRRRQPGRGRCLVAWSRSH
jgi:hypothetical protein